MFDAQLWDRYLDEWRWNAQKAGATNADILELLHLEMGRLLPRVKAEEARKETHGRCEPQGVHG
jgi:hypothetical protein